jgi:hypothetical protein
VRAADRSQRFGHADVDIALEVHADRLRDPQATAACVVADLVRKAAN